MAILGNLLLVIAGLTVIGLNTGALAKSAPGGDAAVGYAWSLIILNFVFFVTMLLATVIIGYKGGFDWVSSKRGTRLLIVGTGVICALITAVATSMFRHEPGPTAGLLRAMTTFIPVALPVAMIVLGFILLNNPIRESLPLAAYKWPIVVITAIGFIGAASTLMTFYQSSARNRAAIIKDRAEFEDRNHQRMLDDIDSNDVSKNLVFLLVFTGNNQEADVRERAVAKVKTHPQWQQELIRLLQTDWAAEPFQFLASNDVDNPELFLEPVNEGVKNQARLIRQSIRNASHPSHFYDSQFIWEVERVLRTVDKFKGKGVDYLPAIKELKDAFNEPSDFEKPKWRCIDLLDKWIKKNS